MKAVSSNSEILNLMHIMALWESYNAASSSKWAIALSTRLDFSLPWIPLFSQQPAQLFMETHPLRI